MTFRWRTPTVSRPPTRPRPCAVRLELLEDRLAPATFTVTNAKDFGPGSLRQAVLDANANPGADLVDFSSYFNMLRTITLASEIGISGPVTIDGPSAANVIISGNNAVRIFNTQSAPAGTEISLVDVTLISGRALINNGLGGAVLVGDEALSATRCTFAANNAFGNITFYNAGGAIAVQDNGSLTATDCVFSSNSAALG